MTVKTHKDLDVWKRGIDFVSLLYKVTASFPKDEIYGLTSQMRRSGVSIPSNIAEGSARNHDAEFRQFLYVALGSSAELDTQLVIARKLEYLNEADYFQLSNELNEISRMLQGLIKSIKKFKTTTNH